MPLYKFGRNDVFYNQIKAHPKTEFFIYGGNVYYNGKPTVSGTHVGNAGHHDAGHLSLYELNVDRPTGQLIYPFITKDGSLTSFSTVTTENFNNNFVYGDTLSGSYPMTSSYHREYHAASSTRTRITALKNTFDYYAAFNSHYQYTSSMHSRDLSTANLNLISIPSIFYGSSIKKGSVDLRFYLTGSLIGRAQDINKDGSLIQTAPANSFASGNVVGVVLYNEGCIVLTGAYNLTDEYTQAYEGITADEPKWVNFGYNTATNGTSSYVMSFSGSTYTPVLTMKAHAPKNQLNFSNNPTFLDSSLVNTTGTVSSSHRFIEPSRTVKNVVSSSYHNYKEPYEKTTYISKIGIYDQDKNLIAIAKLAKPIKKTNEIDYTFKMKLDV